MGAMGTGSTLLRLMLDSHEQIAIPRETGFMRAFNANKFIPFKWSGRGWYKRLGWSDEEWDEHLGAFYDTAFRRLLEKEGKTRWGDKTPYHTWHIDDMARVFPDAQFVGMVRHPGGCVASNVTRWDGEKNPVFAYSLPRAAYHYLKYHTEIARQASRYSDRFTVVRYEDLVLQPEALMRELLDWLGEPWSDQVLDHHNVQPSRGGKLQVEGRVRVDDPIDVQRISKWTGTINEAGRRKLKRRIGRIGEFWGYTVDDPLTFDSLAPDGRVLIRGEDVEARIPRFGDIDFNTQPPVPRADRFYHPRDMKLAGVVTDAADGQPTPAEERPWPRTRIRRAALPVVRRLPQPARRRLAAAARRRWERGLTT
jgi:sulfotransferase family protein